MDTKLPTKTELTLFYDGLCPICRQNMAKLRRWDKQHRLAFTDIRQEEFRAENYDCTLEDMLRLIHARRKDGRLLIGMAAIREAYSLTGRGWLVRATAWPFLRPVFDYVYRLIADNRLSISRLPFVRSRCSNNHCRL